MAIPSREDENTTDETFPAFDFGIGTDPIQELPAFVVL